MILGLVLGAAAAILWALAYRWGYADARFDTRYGITGQPTWPFADTEPDRCTACHPLAEEESA